MEFLREFALYLRTRKKLWLVPFFILVALFGVLLVIGGNAALAPLLYTLF